jgi:excisionase family DNA binding protein
MAGRFLTLEEAARHLGVTVDEINRLVDRKQLFPMRDGANVKFKLEEIERVSADRADDAGEASGLALDLSSPSLGGPASGIGGLADDEIVLGDTADEGDSIFADQGPKGEATSGTIVRGGAGGGSAVGDQGSALASSDLDFDSIIAASSPALPKPPAAADSNVAGGSGTLAIDLSNLGPGPAKGSGLGSGLGLSGPAVGDPLGTSGLSLEGDDLGGPGIDLNLNASGIGGSVIGSGVGGSGLGGSGLGGSVVGSGIGGSGLGGSLGDEAFALGGDVGDDDSASVVISTEDSGDSSFFGTVTDDSSESISAAGVPFPGGTPGEDFLDAAGGPPFNALQITGLVFTTLLLLTCCLVMVDLAWTIPSPAGKPVSSPLLKGLTDVFSWK